jgi:hypothetical protein
MAAGSQSAAGGDARSVEAVLNYTIAVDGTMPVTETPADGTPVRSTKETVEPHSVRIEDARPVLGNFTLDGNGFVVVEHPTKVANFYDETQIRSVYYPEMIELVKQQSGAARVVVFDHTLRTGDEAERAARKIREPVQSVHNDYTEWSAPQRVRDIMGEEAESLLQRRFAVIQVWRPINKPVERDPLALADGHSVPFEDYIVAERRYPNRVGQTYRVKYNPGHRWYYLPKMRREEAYVFKVYDSVRDGRVRFTAHTAFQDPASRPDAPPRESIEIRTLAFF